MKLDAGTGSRSYGRRRGVRGAAEWTKWSPEHGRNHGRAAAYGGVRRLGATGTERKEERVREDQQLTREPMPWTARRGEDGWRRNRARTAAAGGGGEWTATANPGLPPRFLGRGGIRRYDGADGGFSSSSGRRNQRRPWRRRRRQWLDLGLGFPGRGSR